MTALIIMAAFWDDRHRSDPRIADLRDEHDWCGMFGAPCANAKGKPVPKAGEIAQLVSGWSFARASAPIPTQAVCERQGATHRGSDLQGGWNLRRASRGFIDGLVEGMLLGKQLYLQRNDHARPEKPPSLFEQPHRRRLGNVTLSGSYP